jgi:hypothetical protein
VTGLLQIWHLAAPVGAWAFYVTCAGGLIAAGFFGFRRLLTLWNLARRSPLGALITALVVLWFVNRSMNSQQYTDHGLYYLNSIRWNAEYPIVPGLANLHNRFGFNNSNFLLHAMLEVPAGRGYSSHVLNGLIAAMAAPIVIQGVRNVIGGSPAERQLGCFTLTLAMILATSAIDRRISSATPDFPAALMITVAAWRLLALSAIESESRPATLRWNLLVIALLAVTAITMKTMVIFFAVFAGIALAWCLYRIHSRHDPSPAWPTMRSLAFVAACGAFLFVPWVARGYVLSGYPLFPSTVGGISVDWSYDRNEAEKLRQDIYAYARTYHLNIEQGYGPGWDWVPAWIVQVALLRGPVEVIVPAALAAVCLASLIWLARKSPPEHRENEQPDIDYITPLLLAMAYFLAIVAWFVTAPSPRMGSFALWGFAATLLGMVARSIPVPNLSRYRPVILAAAAALLLLPMLDEAARIELRYRKTPKLPEFGSHFYEYLPFVLPKATGENGFSQIPTGDLMKQTTNSGLAVYVGRLRPDGVPDLVWDSPLPTARFFDRNLALRRPDALSGGFKIVKAPADAAPTPKAGLVE